MKNRIKNKVSVPFAEDEYELVSDVADSKGLEIADYIRMVIIKDARYYDNHNPLKLHF